MSEKSESSPKLWHVIIPAITALLVALIGLGTAIYQTEKPVQLTEAARQTESAPTQSFLKTQAVLFPTNAAQTLQAVVAATLSAATTQTAASMQIQKQPTTISTPSVSVINKLLLPIKITINGINVGDVIASSTSRFNLDSSPAVVKWSVVKQTTQKGVPLGHEMGGTFSDILAGDEITLDNQVGDQFYFYPLITNSTSDDCTVTINKGWTSEFLTNAIVSANSSGVGFGYYMLFTNSNVTLDCNGKVYWWGQQPNEAKGTSFYDDVEKSTGKIDFTLKP